MRLEVAEDEGAAARRAAELVAARARDAVAQRGTFALALSGGRTPGLMCEALGDQDVPWDATDVFQVDERVANEGDPDRNLTHLRACLPEAAVSRLRPMPVSETDLERACKEYGAELPDRLDLVHLGLGPDGHTASLVPGDPVLEVMDRHVALTAGEYQGHRRMTLTYPALAAAQSVFFLVTGQEKREALQKLLVGEEGIPAGRVKAADVMVIADLSAAPGEGGHFGGL